MVSQFLGLSDYCAKFKLVSILKTPLLFFNIINHEMFIETFAKSASFRDFFQTKMLK